MYMCARHISTQIVMWAISCWCAWHFVNMPTFCWCEVHVHVACWVFFFLLWYIGCASHIHVINLYHNDKNHDWINLKKKKRNLKFSFLSFQSAIINILRFHIFLCCSFDILSLGYSHTTFCLEFIFALEPDFFNYWKLFPSMERLIGYCWTSLQESVFDSEIIWPLVCILCSVFAVMQLPKGGFSSS